MADQDSTMTDADKIRQKRLAKLGGSGPGASSSAAPASSPSTSTPAHNENRTQPAPSPSQVSAEHKSPPPSASVAPQSTSAPKINIKPKVASAPVAPPVSKTPESQMSPESWEDRAIGGIFRVTLDPTHTRNGHGQPLTYLGGVKGDLESEGAPVRLSLDVLDQVILESASSKSQGRPLDYLLGCWKRVARQFRSMGLHQKNDPKYNILKEARRLCFSYCIFAVTMPDMFGEDNAPVSLAEHLLVDSENDRGICHDFLHEAASRFSEDDSVREAVVGAMEQLSLKLAQLSMNDNYKPYVLAMRNVVRYQPILLALSQSDMFLPEGVAAQDIEKTTLLGPYFRLSPLQPEVALNYFSGASARDKAYVANSQKALRMTLQTHQDELLDIANAFIKAKDSRERVLDWFALTVNANHKRRALQVDRKAVSTDGFMVNVTTILDRLCEPFMDATFSKIDRIDIDYLRRSPRVRIEDETKINADQPTSDAFYEVKASGTNNFITEVFFLTVAAHHYGTEATHGKLTSLSREMKHLEKSLAEFETERHKFAHSPATLARFDDHVRKIKDQVEKGHCVIHSTQGVLSDEVSQARSMQFMRYVIVWLLRLVAPELDPVKKKMNLPLRQEQPEAFKCLPEYFVEDIVDNFKFITRTLPQIITNTQCEELMMVCITFLRSSEYIKNPYLKSGLITILFHGVWPVHGRARGILGDVLFAHNFATQHLLHAMMKFYIECESTGAHTQFFDKFNIRYEIFQVIKCIWPNSVYRENLATEARVNLDFFVQFVNLLLNDVTFVLDESFTAFAQIHDIQRFLRNVPEDAENIRQEKEEQLSAAQSKAKNYMQLTNETVAMLKLFTETLSDSFTKPEVVVRLAHMLDYNLELLVGPKKAQLKVENAEEYGWNPKQMIAEITDVYLNLQHKKNFVDAVAGDGRSYKPENFDSAYAILSRFALKSPEQLADWQKLGERIRTAREEAELEEADLGEIPDEFTDPLLATLMEDPVILPKSRAVLDRSTIRSHLLSDPNDPFNRAPLKIEDVIPDTELKAKIQAWKSEKLAARRAANAGGEPMDTS